MASSAISLCSPSLTSSRAAVLHQSQQLNPNRLSFPINSNTVKRAPNLAVQHAPLPLKVLCGRGNRGATTKKSPTSDPVYQNRLVNMFVNRILKRGKKSLAYQIIYRALKKIQQKTESNPLAVLRAAVQGVTPDVSVKSRRVGGSTHQVPVEVGTLQGKALAIRWLLEASRKRQGRSMVLKLSSEVMDAAKGNGEAIRKKETTHKMAEANRAFVVYGEDLMLAPQTYCVLDKLCWPTTVTQASWEKSILKSDIPVLVEFYASWCGPCRMVHRVIDEIATEYDGKLKCFVLNTDSDLQIAEDYEIKAVPVVLLFKNGEKQEAVVGTMPKEFYIAAIERVMQS
ncbi:unnamed protein product [Dovyalis caffra]|uniref:Ribosomal protein S7 n=1 Tax=Dovyalis caffra TaxID=77055 RepID=A0AAV1R8W8_9ROSI|nr:unnamed protein product [Dovyalis caffra]